MVISNGLATYILQNKLATYSRSWVIMRCFAKDNAGYFYREEFIKEISSKLQMTRQSAYKHLRKLEQIGWISHIKQKEYRLVGHELLHRMLGIGCNYTTEIKSFNLKQYKSQLLAIHTAVRNKRQYFYELKRRGGNRKIAKRNLQYEGVDTQMDGYYACSIASEDLSLHHSTVMSYRKSDFFHLKRGADVPLKMFSSEKLHLVPEFARKNFQATRQWCDKKNRPQVRVGGCYTVSVPVRGNRFTLKPFSLINTLCLKKSPLS